MTCKRCCTVSLQWTSGGLSPEHCIDEIGQWMASNHLKLAADKTDFLWLGMCNQLMKLTPRCSLKVGSYSVKPVNST